MNRCNRFDVNSISAWITNYGSLFRNPFTGNCGFEWPKRSGKFAIYATGLWLGAKVNGEARVALAEYSYDYRPGTIDDFTYLPNDHDDPHFRVYKINRGITDSWDYRHWSYEDGAPLDADGNPLIIGDQTLWCVFNDADTSGHIRMESLPLGVEVQQTVFGWFRNNLNDAQVFIRWLIVNKGIHHLNSVYITLWADPDIGDNYDDLIGCDSTLSLGFCYNASNYDKDYGINPPAIGFQVLQGPLVFSSTDSGIYMGWKRYGSRNLPLTSFVSYGEPGSDPKIPSEVLYLMDARWTNGQRFTLHERGQNPNNPPTNFMFSGDPESGIGWLDSYARDTRMIINSGPFNLAPGDSQEVVIGTIIARGNSHLNSVTYLKHVAHNLKLYYDKYIYKMLRTYPGKPSQWQVVDKLVLFQNYPNPFNVQTTISYELPINRNVKLELYNIFGQRVATLVNERQEPGIYEVVWDAAGLPSGLYFANLRVAQYQLTKKLLLLK